MAELFADVPPADPDPNVLPPDIAFVVSTVTRIRDLGLLAQVGVDAAGIGAIVDALAKIGVTQDAETLDAVRQGIALMGAIKTIERKLADGSFRHGVQELLSWCVGNLIIVPTATAMRVGRDEAGFGKIDPLMAIFNAAHLMSLNPESTGSVYTAERGLLVFGV
jgi:phage terminase large subunit-like protein